MNFDLDLLDAQEAGEAAPQGNKNATAHAKAEAKAKAEGKVATPKDRGKDQGKGKGRGYPGPTGKAGAEEDSTDSDADEPWEEAVYRTIGVPHPRAVEDNETLLADHESRKVLQEQLHNLIDASNLKVSSQDEVNMQRRAADYDRQMKYMDVKVQMTCETEAERRCQLQSQDKEVGQLGTTISIDVPKDWKDPSERKPANFVDTMNELVKSIQQATAWVEEPMDAKGKGKGRGRRGLKIDHHQRFLPKFQQINHVEGHLRRFALPHFHVVEELQRRCFIVFIFLARVVQYRFDPSVASIFQEVHDCFARPSDGICKLLFEWLAENELPSERQQDLRGRFNNALANILILLERAMREGVNMKQGVRLTDFDEVIELFKLMSIAFNATANPAQLSVQDHERVERLWEVFNGDGFPGKIMKTNALTMTWLLMELRGSYLTPRFQEAYWSLRHRMRANGPDLVELTLTVQSVVLPKYGFPGDVMGVNEMRNEVSVHNDSDLVVFKLMKDIHKILDYGLPLPKIPVIRPLQEVRRFQVLDCEAWKKHLCDFGFAVIANVAEKEQVEDAYDLLWQFLERSDGNGKVKRSDPKSWKHDGVDGWGWPADETNGIIQRRGVGQCEALWYLRSLPAVKQVFASIWGTESLVTSMDGAGVFRPYGHSHSWKTDRRHWCHIDQGHQKRGLQCVQGLVTLKPATAETGGFVVVPGSHRFHHDILSRYPWTHKDSIHLEANDLSLTDGDSRPSLVEARAGDLIIWDSRTVHCNVPPLVENQELLNGKDLLRAVAYICMTPAAWCSDEVVGQRSKAFQQGVTSTHWPHELNIVSRNLVEPSFELTREQRELLCPQTAGGAWSSHMKDVAPNKGKVSCHPERPFQVAAEQLESWSVPRYDRIDGERPVGFFSKDTTLRGHVFDRWLRISSWPIGTLQALSGEDGAQLPAPQLVPGRDELWALMLSPGNPPTRNVLPIEDK
mmetsp:Transcript_20556/g.43742  ORF Transcript_20556/g.43742 Transcript_20556/m.43742 type:complete len:964 (-) Transcript_20556:34-2925(-)